MLKDDDERQISFLGGDGILRLKDLPDLTAATERVLKLMKDMRWHSAEEILKVADQREGLRRMRELRKRGYEVERKRGEGREFYYRLKD